MTAAERPCYRCSPLRPHPPGDSILRRFARKIDAFQERWGIGVSWLTLGMVLIVFGDVVFRYLFNKSWVFIQELEWHLFGLVYLLVAGYTILHNEHVRVDIWYAKQSARKKAWVDFILALRHVLPVVRPDHLHDAAVPEALAPSERGLYVGNYTDRDVSILKVDGATVRNTGKRFKLPGQPASMRGAAG